MTREDDRILDHLESERWSMPSIMAAELFKKVSTGHVRERLLYLEYAGLVARLHSDTWVITSEGSRYVDGDLDATLQPRPNRGAVFDQWTPGVWVSF